jgi:hypothetical protein
VYDAALLADAEKSADRTIGAQIMATKLSHTAILASEIPKVNNNNNSFREFPQPVKKKDPKPSIRFKNLLYLINFH